MGRKIFAAALALAAIGAVFSATNVFFEGAPRRTRATVAGKQERQKKPAPPFQAKLSLTFLAAETSQPLSGVSVALSDRYYNADSSGLLVLEGLRTSRVKVAARHPERRFFQADLPLRAGDNYFPVYMNEETATIGATGPARMRLAYITIDDGPSRKWTPKVLDVLKRERVAATFFLVGWRVERRGDIVRRIYMEGHTIGNHTYSHNYAGLYGGSVRRYLDSLDKNSRILKGITGDDVRISRPPGGITGNFRGGWQRSVSYAGYKTVLWNVTTGDGATQTTSWQMEQNVKTYLDKLLPTEPAVVLMHDVREPIVKALPKIIAELRRRGFEFAVIDRSTKVDGVIY